MAGRRVLRPSSDEIGARGENLFELAITDYQAFEKPLFRPAFLGEKWPTVDYYVELLGVEGLTPFFFAQVKSTTSRLPTEADGLVVQVSMEKCVQLYELPGPTFVAGVHEPQKRVFLRAVHEKPTSGMYTIPLDHELTPENLRRLHEEVAGYWQAHYQKPAESYFR